MTKPTSPSIDPSTLKRVVSSWPHSEQVIFIAVFIEQKPREQIAHDLGIPLNMLERKVEELTRRFRFNSQPSTAL